MQSNSGLLRWLKVPCLYNLLQDAVGGNALRRKVIQKYVRARAGNKLIDIGCGPAQVLTWLPDVQYLGLDISSHYIASARRTHGNKGTFVVGDTKSLRGDSRFKDADIVILTGSILDPRNYVVQVLIDGSVAYDIKKEKRRF